MMLLKPAGVKKIYQRLDAQYPVAETKLHFNNVFELLVAVVLSAQCTDEQVNRVTKKLFLHYRKPDDFAECDLQDLERLIRGVGLYHNKAKNIKAMAQIIRDQYHNQVPDNWDHLLSLPGVGRKTANVVLAVGFGLPGLGVDTHVHRVSNRLGLVHTKNAQQTELQLKAILPEGNWGKAHHLLIYHGRQVCRARKALCETCFLNDLCEKNMET